MMNKQIKVYLGLRTSLIFLFFYHCFPGLYSFYFYVFFVLRHSWAKQVKFLQRGEVRDVIEDGGCKTCNLGNKQQEKKFRLYLRGLAGGRRKLLQLRANLRSTDKSQN